MIRYLIRKTLYALLTLWSVCTVVFFLFSASFPSPEEMLVTDRTDEATITSIRNELGLNDPLGIQYFKYMNDLSPVAVYHEDPDIPAFARFQIGQRVILIKPPYLRRSFQSGNTTTSILGEAFVGTAVLALASIFIASVLGILFGMISAIRQRSWLDQLILFISTIGVSIPSFFSAIIVGWIFGYLLSDLTGLNLTGSLYDLHPFEGKIIVWKNLILPAVALGIRPLAIITQLTRSSMIETLGSDYIRTARAKGLSHTRIYFVHALRNAINPVLTSISGWFASLLAGAFFVEYIFGWHGIGKVTIDALEKSDLPVIMGSVILIASIFVFTNILVDILYTILDPRIKRS